MKIILTPEQIKQIVALNKDGLSWQEIADSDHWVRIVNTTYRITGKDIAAQVQREPEVKPRKNYPARVELKPRSESISDKQLYLDHHVKGMSYTDIAELYDFSEDSVRGRISKASKIPGVYAEAIEMIQNRRNLQTSAELKRKALLNDSIARHKERQEILSRTFDEVVLLKLNDIHFPHARVDALELAYQIAEWLNPHYVTTFDDLWDFSNYGRWEEMPDAAVRLWTRDISNAVEAAKFHHASLLRFAPRAYGGLIQLMGNHDKRLYHYLASSEESGFQDHNTLWFTQEMINQGVTMFVDHFHKENVVQITPGLKVTHGISASSNRAAVSKKTIEACAGSVANGDEGVFYHTMGGHTHDAFKHTFHGVTHTNSPCLCRRDVDYLSHHPNNWQLGVSYAIASTRDRAVMTNTIVFKEEGNALVAYIPDGSSIKGRRIETELKKETTTNY